MENGMTLAKATDRRALLKGGLIATPLLLLPGCTTGLGGFGLTEAIRRLLSLSSQRAFATLLQPGGFWDNQAARIPLPARIAGDRGLITQVLTSNLVRDRVGRELNRSAERGAERAAPIVAERIRTLDVADALSIVRGGPRAATAMLEGSLGTVLIDAMFPAVGDALRLTSEPLVGQVLRGLTGYDVSALSRDVTSGANRAIWNAIGVEEEGIRANPRATNDPVLISVFGLAR